MTENKIKLCEIIDFAYKISLWREDESNGGFREKINQDLSGGYNFRADDNISGYNYVYYGSKNGLEIIVSTKYTKTDELSISWGRNITESRRDNITLLKDNRTINGFRLEPELADKLLDYIRSGGNKNKSEKITYEWIKKLME